jgi:hypothetical protein
MASNRSCVRLLVCLLLAAAFNMSGCGSGGDDDALAQLKDQCQRSPSPACDGWDSDIPAQLNNQGTTTVASALPVTADGQGQRALPAAGSLTERELQRHLLPHTAVSTRLVPAGETFLPNELGGAVVEYLPPVPRTVSEGPVAVTSSVALYQTAAGAGEVIADPSLESTLAGLGLRVAEAGTERERVGDESRMFRGMRDGDGPHLTSYVVTFLKDAAIGTVVVTIPATADDGGRLALDLAQRQAAT